MHWWHVDCIWAHVKCRAYWLDRNGLRLVPDVMLRVWSSLLSLVSCTFELLHFTKCIARKIDYNSLSIFSVLFSQCLSSVFFHITCLCYGFTWIQPVNRIMIHFGISHEWLDSVWGLYSRLKRQKPANSYISMDTFSTSHFFFVFKRKFDKTSTIAQQWMI